MNNIEQIRSIVIENNNVFLKDNFFYCLSHCWLEMDHLNN